jgi:hypothetical protein
MASNGFNDGTNETTLSFSGATIGALLSCSVDQTCAEIDVSGASDAEKIYVGGQRDRKFTCEVVGTPDTVVPSQGALSIAWQDGSTSSAATAVCVQNSTSGSLNGAITSTLAFRVVSA